MAAKEFLERDHEIRVACCKDILENVPFNAVLITSDEAHFHVSGFVNKQNFRYRSESNLRDLHERTLLSEQMTMWCAVANFGVWSTYFFEQEDKVISNTLVRYA